MYTLLTCIHKERLYVYVLCTRYGIHGNESERMVTGDQMTRTKTLPGRTYEYTHKVVNPITTGLGRLLLTVFRWKGV